MDELKTWLRFSETDAVATRDGLFDARDRQPDQPLSAGRTA